MQDFKDAGISKDMANATCSTRRLISSAFSIFIFTFQGIVETMLSTWDCKVIENRKFLRYRPDIECSISNSDIYANMVAISSVGLVVYTFVVPICVVVVVRSRWAREIYSYNFVAYDQLFGFITSQYTAAFVSWEAVNCLRKLLLIAIPMVIATSPITQSLSNIALFLLYAMVIVALKPMTSSYLNKIEVLNSFNIIISLFAAILFTVQYENVYVLQGDSRDIVGIALVVFISLTFVISLRLIYVEFRRLYAVHKNPYLSRWLRIISAKAGGSILLGKYLPISLLFLNETSSRAIQDEVDAGDKIRQQVLSSIDNRWFSTGSLSSLVGYFVLAFAKAKLWLKESRRASSYQISDDAANETMAEPDYEFFMWMHKLLQRTLAWKPREQELRRTEFVDLPKIFTVKYGDSDPPIAVCDSLLRTSRAVDDILNPDHKNLLLAFMLTDGAIDVRSNLDRADCSQYQLRMHAMVDSFKLQLAKHTDVCEMFRDTVEIDLEHEVCGPLRRQLYGARVSEDVKVLDCIASSTLRQYNQQQKSAASGNGRRMSCVDLSPDVNMTVADPKPQRSFAKRAIPGKSKPVFRNRTRSSSSSSSFSSLSNGQLANTVNTNAIANRGPMESTAQSRPTRLSSKPQPPRNQAGGCSVPGHIELEEIVIDCMDDVDATKANVQHQEPAVPNRIFLNQFAITITTAPPTPRSSASPNPPAALAQIAQMRTSSPTTNITSIPKVLTSHVATQPAVSQLLLATPTLNDKHLNVKAEPQDFLLSSTYQSKSQHSQNQDQRSSATAACVNGSPASNIPSVHYQQHDQVQNTVIELSSFPLSTSSLNRPNESATAEVSQKNKSPPNTQALKPTETHTSLIAAAVTSSGDMSKGDQPTSTPLVLQRSQRELTTLHGKTESVMQQQQQQEDHRQQQQQDHKQQQQQNSSIVSLATSIKRANSRIIKNLNPTPSYSLSASKPLSSGTSLPLPPSSVVFLQPTQSNDASLPPHPSTSAAAPSHHTKTIAHCRLKLPAHDESPDAPPVPAPSHSLSASHPSSSVTSLPPPPSTVPLLRPPPSTDTSMPPPPSASAAAPYNHPKIVVHHGQKLPAREESAPVPPPPVPSHSFLASLSTSIKRTNSRVIASLKPASSQPLSSATSLPLPPSTVTSLPPPPSTSAAALSKYPKNEVHRGIKPSARDESPPAPPPPVDWE
jgi:hypothetical protein